MTLKQAKAKELSEMFNEVWYYYGSFHNMNLCDKVVNPLDKRIVELRDWFDDVVFGRRVV
jgi:hypothetical protein